MGRESAIKATNTFARFMRNSLTGRTQRRQDRSTRPNCVFSERGNVGSVVSCVLLPEVSKFGERGGGQAGIDGFCAEADTLFQIRAETRGNQCGCGVQKHDVAARAGYSREDVVEMRRIPLNVAPGEFFEFGTWHTGHLRSNSSGFNG